MEAVLRKHLQRRPDDPIADRLLVLLRDPGHELLGERMLAKRNPLDWHRQVLTKRMLILYVASATLDGLTSPPSGLAVHAGRARLRRTDGAERITRCCSPAGVPSST